MTPPAAAPASLLRVAAALAYLDRLDTIDGWLAPDAALAMIETLWLQERSGITGDLAEIGVYRGKSFLALAAGAREQESLFAIDLFDTQDPAAARAGEDTSLYGSGNRAVFLANMERFFPGRAVRILETSSRELRGTATAAGLAGLRLLSIDGGHTREMTLNDLAIAAAVLGPDGVCFLDDPLNAHWTGVVSGLFAFLDTAPDLCPVAMFPNKLLLCRAAAAGFYRDGLRGLFAASLERKEIEFHHAGIDVYGAAWPQVSANLRIPHLPLIAAAERAEAARAAAEAAAGVAAARAERAEEAAAAYAASTCWRITAPLRALVRQIAPRRR